MTSEQSINQHQSTSIQDQDQETTQQDTINNNINRVRSRTSTTATAASASSSSSSAAAASSSSSHSSSSSSSSASSSSKHESNHQPPTKRSKTLRGSSKKSNKSNHRSSNLNQINPTKKHPKTTDSHHSPTPMTNKLDDDLQESNENPTQDDPNITRCVCGEDNDEANDVIMFQCDKCSVWQHGPCIGLYAEFPGDYFCEKCRPDLHTNGQYQKSSPHQSSRRSPSFTSSSSRRERVNPDAASLAAFLTDAGVKPEDQISLGGFALPTFAHTRRQSNMLVDGLTPLISAKKQESGQAIGSTSGAIIENSSAIQSLDPHKPKRKRPSLDPVELPPLQGIEPGSEEKHKRPRFSPAVELPSPAPSVSTTTSKQYNPPSATSQTTGQSGKQKRTRKVDDTGDSGPNGKAKAASVFGNKSKPQGSNSGPGKRGSPTKRTTKEDGRRTKNHGNSNHNHSQHGENQLESTLSEGWGLPDHLAYLDYLLPTPTPQPIVVEGMTGEGISKQVLEAPTKVKFPSKRTTIADLRKRSKHLVDYLQKVQIECSDREKRNELISKSLHSKPDPKALSHSQSPSALHHSPFLLVESVVSSKTLEIIDDLSRQLYHWQEKFKQN